jgi:hypothetical protein
VRLTWLPPLALAVYGVAFAGKALGGGLLVFDDHPGQLFRLSHALTVGLAPWRLNPGWWAGYAELQFYPPGFSYLGAAIHAASLGALDPGATYRALLWLTFLLPGIGTYVLLSRVLGSPWLALPGAVLALVLSAGSRSGVEEGMRWGMVAARLGWGVLPILACALHRWTARRAPPIEAAAVLAAIILIHPAHAPAGAALVLLAAWHGPGPRLARLGDGGLLIAAAVGLAAFWLVPLLAHLSMALPLAWGQLSLAGLASALAEQPLLVALLAASAVGRWWARRDAPPAASSLWLLDWVAVMAVVIVLDALVAEPLGLAWLPADRLLDSFLLALILGASVALGTLARRAPAVPAPVLGVAAIALACVLPAPARPEPTLSLWPQRWPNEWPTYVTVARGARMAELWDALATAPAGRVLFVRSGVPLEYRQDWRRPHSHITALTPLVAGREILNGTFTHSSPVAGLIYTGSPANRPITTLVEQRDGVTLFGRPLTELDARSFHDLADRLRVSVVVALDEDEGRLAFVADDPAFQASTRIGPFLLFVAREPRPIPERTGPQRWRLPAPPHDGGWARAGVAYSPLWHASTRAGPLPIRRDPLGLLEVQARAGDAGLIEIEHRAGAVERSALAVSGVCALALLAVAADGRRRRRLTRAGRS